MDLFKLLTDTLTPVQQLEWAVKNNDLVKLEQLLANGMDPNRRIHHYGGNTGVHLAANFGNYLCIERFLEAGASADAPNDSDVTPLFMAARGNHVRAMRVLLKWSTSVTGIDTLWCLGKKWTQLLWSSNHEDAIMTLLIATPCLDMTRRNLRVNLFEVCNKTSLYKCMRVWIESGNTLEPAQIESISSIAALIPIGLQLPGQGLDDIQGLDDVETEKPLKTWMLEYRKTPQSLQHCCRISIRRSFHSNCNVFHGVTKLQIPTTLKQYICFQC